MLTEELIADPSVKEELDFQQLLPHCDGGEIRAIQSWYASDFDRRVTELTELLRIEITEQLRTQFNAELQSRIAAFQSEHRSGGENQNTAVTQELLEEIAAAQEDLQKKEAELAKRMTEDVFPFAEVLQLRGEKTELASYLKGLSFRAAAAGIRGR